MTDKEALIFAYVVTVAVFSAFLIYRLGWHWLTFWAVFPALFFGFAFVGGMLAAVIDAFTGNRRQ